MKNKSIFIIVFIIAALVVIKIFFLKKDDQSTQTSAPKNQVTKVTGFVVAPTILETKISSTGSIIANEEVELKPETSGKLISISFKEGGTVTKGELLVKINDADLQANLKKLNLQLKLAKEKESRMKSLLEIKGISQEEYDQSANQLETIAADIDFTRAQIAKTEIRAPFTGKIGLKNVSEGSFVNNTTIIASIQQTEILKLDFSIPEKYAAVIAVGDTVKFKVEGIRENLIAKIFAIEPKIDALTRNILIRAIYSNSKMNVYPGAFAKIELITNRKESSFMIPTESVIPEMKGNKVYTCKNGKAIKTIVETGVRTDSRIEIISGLNSGDTVITTGIMSLKPDAAIQIIQLKN